MSDMQHTYDWLFPIGDVGKFDDDDLNGAHLYFTVQFRYNNTQ